MACCMCERYGWIDPQPVVHTDPKGKEYCLFHAPCDEKKMDGEKLTDEGFNEQVKKRIQAACCEGPRYICDFSGAIFPYLIGFSEFGAYSQLEHIRFVESFFYNVVEFNGVHFGGSAIFNKAVFAKTAYFNGAEFFKRGSFMRATFREGASFVDATFKGDTFFDRAYFEGGIDSDRGKSSGNVSLSSSTKQCSTLFQRAVFEKNAHFELTSFQGKCDFSQSSFTNVDFIGIRSPGPLIFRRCNVKEGQFIDTDLSSFDFLTMDVTNLSFPNSNWPEENGRYKISQEDKLGSLPFVRDFYQRMKAKYKAENNEYEASRWHVAEKEAQLKLLGQSEGVKFNWFMLWLYKQSSFFGEWPRRAFKVLLALIALPLLFLLVAAGADVQIDFFGWTFHFAPAADLVGEWLKYIPLARKISDEPSSGWRAFMLFWQLLITIQAALFAFALRNNFRR